MIRFSGSHEWIRVEKGVGRVGITDVGQRMFGPVTRVWLPLNGEKVTIAGPIGQIQTDGYLHDIYSPVSGTVLELNEALNHNPSLVNTEAMGAGWLLTIRLSAPLELESLLDECHYYRSIE